MPAPARRLATVLFLDIVGSTSIADELGDEDWRALLARFRSVVRAQLKSFGGHEVDDAGDGFFATFDQPFPAVRAARAIAEAVQSLGLDVRLGLHAGDVEVADKHVAGIAVHIGARVMALAKPAQILVTSTFRDMELGTPVTFVDAGEHSLKGVEGIWHLFSVTEVVGESLPVPLDPKISAQDRRVAATQPRRRVRLIAASVVVLLAISALIIARPRHVAPYVAPQRIVLMRYDPASGRIVATASSPESDQVPIWPPGDLGGKLVRVSGDRAEFRDLTSGALQSHFSVPGFQVVSIGAGAVWIGSVAGATNERWLRFDPLSGKETGQVRVLEPISGVGYSFGALEFGPGGGWYITQLGKLARLDSISLQVKSWPLPAGAFTVPVPYRTGVWVHDAANGQLVWFDESKDRVNLSLSIPKGNIVIVDGASPYSWSRVSLFDPVTQRITPLGEGVIDEEKAFNVVGAPSEMLNPRRPILFGTKVRGTLWLAAYAEPAAGKTDSAVVGVPEDKPGTQATVVYMPAGFEASWILPGPNGGSIWVGSCYCPEPHMHPQPRS